jgi:hypothetical protein
MKNTNTRDAIEYFTEFVGRPNRTSSEVPRVTLNRKGEFYLNGHAYAELGEPAALKLYFDGNNRVIGLKPADIRHANAFPVRKNECRRSRHRRVIRASPFCVHFGIHVNGTIVFTDIEVDTRTNLMRLDLRTAVKVTRGSS